MKVLFWTVWLGTIGLALGSNGCGTASCTEMDWNGPVGLEISVTQKDSGAIVAGQYQFDVEADGIYFTATCDPTQEPLSNCKFVTTVGSDIHVRLLTNGEQPLSFFVIQIINRVDGAYSGNISGPTNATVVVGRDGTEMARATYVPVYVREEPNGEGCGYYAHSADALVI